MWSRQLLFAWIYHLWRNNLVMVTPMFSGSSWSCDQAFRFVFGFLQVSSFLWMSPTFNELTNNYTRDVVIASTATARVTDVPYIIKPPQYSSASFSIKSYFEKYRPTQVRLGRLTCSFFPAVCCCANEIFGTRGSFFHAVLHITCNLHYSRVSMKLWHRLSIVILPPIV